MLLQWGCPVAVHTTRTVSAWVMGVMYHAVYDSTQVFANTADDSARWQFIGVQMAQFQPSGFHLIANDFRVAAYQAIVD